MPQATMEDNATPAGAPKSIEEALESGFLPDDPNYRLTGKLGEPTKEEEENPDEHAENEDEQQPAGEGEHEQHEEEHEEDEHHENSATPGDKGGEKAAASQAAPKPGKKENRFAKLSRENRELREKLARAEGREEGRSSTASNARDTRQNDASRTAAAADQATPEPKIDDVDPATNKPKYATLADFLSAHAKWSREEIMREFGQKNAQTEQQRRQQQENQEIGRKLNESFDKSRTRHADFDKVALSEKVVIPFHSVVDRFLQDSEHAGEVAYYLGQHPEILEGFYECSGERNAATGKPGPYVKDGNGLKAAWRNKTTPERQFRKLMEIEAQVSKAAATPGSKPGAAEGVNGTQSSSKTITRASRPPHQTSGHGAVTKDAAEQAVEDNDFETYARTVNERDPRVRALRKNKD